MSVQTPRDGATAPANRDKDEVKECAATIMETLRTGDPSKPEDNGHRFCANCFSQIRTVAPPKPDEKFFNRWTGSMHVEGNTIDITSLHERYPDSPETAQSAIGFASPTERTQEGEVVVSTSETRPDEIVRTGRICECGATSHRQEERPVTKATAVRYARNLSDSVNALRNEYKMGPASDTEEQRIRGWLHSRTLLEDTVRQLKEDPTMQGKAIFEASLAVALRRPNV